MSEVSRHSAERTESPAEATEGPTRSGYIAIVGRPNVGKSTLLNRLVGAKIASTAPKPQTTRHNITGILTEGDTQMVFVDTPGIHRGGRRLLNRVINEAALAALQQVDLAVFVIDRTRWTEEDALVLERIRASGRPAIAAVNKVDAVDKKALLPALAALQRRHSFEAYVPVSAVKGTNLDALKAEIRQRLPEGPFLFPEDQISSRSERFIATELIREQLVRTLRDEVPHAVFVEIDSLEERPRLVAIGATVWVERPSQRAIVIGRKGAMLKKIGARARRSLESFFGKQVYLELWVKDKAGWQDNPRVLASFDTTGL